MPWPLPSSVTPEGLNVFFLSSVDDTSCSFCSTRWRYTVQKKWGRPGVIYHMSDVRVERTSESLNVGMLTTNMQREAGSFMARPLAARRLMVAVLWQSLRTVSVENNSPGKGSFGIQFSHFSARPCMEQLS